MASDHHKYEGFIKLTSRVSSGDSQPFKFLKFMQFIFALPSPFFSEMLLFQRQDSPAVCEYSRLGGLLKFKISRVLKTEEF